MRPDFLCLAAFLVAVLALVQLRRVRAEAAEESRYNDERINAMRRWVGRIEARTVGPEFDPARDLHTEGYDDHAGN